MANLTSSADIIASALFDSGEPASGSDYATDAVIELNAGYAAIWMGGSEISPEVHEDWTWLRSSTPGTITLLPSSQGSVQVTNNSTAITFGSAPAASVAGYFFKTATNTDVFRIATHTGGSTSATLDSVYTGANGLAAGYTLFKLEYTIPSDVLRPISPMRVYRDNRRYIQGMDLIALEAKWPLSDVQSGVPHDFALVSETKVRFSHYGSTRSGDLIRIDFDYLQKPTLLAGSTEEPLIPYQWRRVLRDYVKFKIMVKKNDQRADGVGFLVRSGLKAMARENQHRWVAMGMEVAHIYPRQNEVAKNMNPLRTESGLIIG